MKDGRSLDKSASFPSWDEYKQRLELKKQLFVQGHTLWANSVLNQKQQQPIQDLRLSVADGVTVLTLLKILGSEKIGGSDGLPLTKPQKVENLQHCVDFLEGQGVDVQGLSPTELADGNLKSTLMLMNSIRKKYDAQYSQTQYIPPDSPKLKPRHSVTSLPSYMTREVSESPPPPPPPPLPRQPLGSNSNSMIGKKLPPPPPPLPSVPPPPTSQPPQPLHGSVGMALKSQSSRSPPVDFLPGTISSPEEMNTQVETTKPRVTSTEVDQDQVSQMGPEGLQHSYAYPPETAQSLKDSRRGQHWGSNHTQQQAAAPTASSPGPPSRVSQAWQANSGPNTPTISRAKTSQTNSKNSSVPSVQEQLNHLLNGSTGEESRNSIGKGLSNGAFQPDDGELLVVPPPSSSESSRNKINLKGFPSSYQPSLASDRPAAHSSRSQAIMSHANPPPPMYRGAPPLPRYQPPPQYSPGQGLRVSGGSESSVFTSGSGNSTPVVPNSVPSPQRTGEVASNDLRNAWNKLYGQEAKVQNIMSSQSMENFSRPKSPSKQTPVHSRQGSQVSHHRRSSPMGQSSSPRSHSSSSQGGISPNESHLPSGHSHTPSASLDNTKSSCDSIPGGHVNLGYQGVTNSKSNFSSRYPEDKHSSQPIVNGVNVQKSPVRTGASSVLPSSPNINVISGYQNNSSGRIGHIDQQHNQRPKTPVLTEQRSRTPTSFDHQRQTSYPNYDQQSYPAGNARQVSNPQLNVQSKPVTQFNSVDMRQAGNGQDILNNSDKRQSGYPVSQFSDQRTSGYSNNSAFVQEQRPKTPVGHEQRPTTPHEQVSDVSVQQGLPLSNGSSKSISHVDGPANHGANIPQDVQSYKVDSLGRPTNAVQQRMEQLKQKSKESHKQAHENIYTGQEFSKSVQAQGINGVHMRQKSQEEHLQMQELTNRNSLPSMHTTTEQLQESKSPYLNNHKLRGINYPQELQRPGAHDLSDRSVTPPLPALSPDNSPPITPPESPGHLVQQRTRAQYLPHNSNEHNLVQQPARVKPPSGRRQGKKNGYMGVKSKKTHPNRHGSRNIPGHSSHSRSSHSRHRVDLMSESQAEDYVEDSELASAEEHDGAGVAIASQEGKVIRQQLEDLETMYTEILKVLGLDKDYLPGSRRSISSNSSISQVTGNRRFRRTHHRRELKHVNKRFQRLESHVVTLARSVAQLSSEMHSQGNLYQELDDIKLEMTNIKHAVAAMGSTQSRPQPNGPQNEWDRFRGWVPGLTNPKRVNKLKQFFGAEPPLLNIFLKKLGYENFTANFEKEHITMIELPYLNEQRLEKIGIPMGPRLRILQESQLCFRQENFDIYIV